MGAPLRFPGCVLLLAVAAALGGCGSTDTSAVSIAVIGETEEPFETGVRLSTAGQLTRSATGEGLVAFDAEGRVVPALADRWIVTDDGKSYIFRLRDGTWLEGGAITSRDVRAGLREAVSALRGTSLARDLAGIDEIRAMAGRVIEIRLHRPMPHFLQLLAQPELALQLQKTRAGPMRMDRVGDTAVLTLIAPSELELPEVEDWTERTRPVNLSAMTAQEAVERFNAGGVDLVLGGRIEHFPLTREVGILRGTIQLDPVSGLFGLLVMNDDGFLSEPANREAISMAIDRASLITPFGLDGWTATSRIVSPGLEGDIGTIGERWGDMTIEERRALAAERVSRWKASRDQDEEEPAQAELVTLSVWLPPGPGSDLLFDGLTEDLATIDIALERADDANRADLQMIDDVARYPRSMWFLNRLACGTRRGLCAKGTDDLAALAMTTEDATERAGLLAEAEAELTISNVFIPFGSPIRWSLVRGDFNGFATNRWGWHPLMPMARVPN